MKRIIAMLVTVSLMISAFAGCGNSSPSSAASAGSGNVSEKEVTIELYGGWTGPDAEQDKQIIADYMKEHKNVKINYTFLQSSALYSKLMTQVSAGDAPDILATQPTMLSYFVSKNLLNSEPVAEMKLQEKDYAKSMWEGSFYQGKQYGVPLDLNMHAIFYNKDLLKAAGIDKAPTTGEELIAAAQKLTVDTAGKHAGETGFNANQMKTYGLGMNFNHHLFYMWYALINQQNQQLFNPDSTKLAVSDDASKKAWTFLSDLVYKYQVVPKAEKAPYDDFRSGKVAMLVDGPWERPDLMKNPVSFGWDVVPFPQVFDTKAAWGNGNVLTFPTKPNQTPEQRAAAEDFVRYMTSSATYIKTGQIPANVNLWDQAKKEMPSSQAFMDSVGYMKILPNIPQSMVVYSAAAPSPILTMGQDVMINQKNSDDAFAKFKQDTENALKTKP